MLRIVFFFAVFAMPAATFAQEFCTEALDRIPYIERSAFLVEDIDRSVWESSKNQEFQTASEFERWSRSRDAGASYKLFSASYGDSSTRASGSFNERYELYSRDYAATIQEFRSNQSSERYPSSDYIREVLSRCVRRDVFVVVTPGLQLRSFTAALKLDSSRSVQFRVSITNGECRYQGSEFTNFFRTNEKELTLECRRTNPDLETIGFSTQFGTAEAKMPTVGIKFVQYERVLARQSAQIIDLRDQLDELRAQVVNNQSAAVNERQDLRNELNALRNAVRFLVVEQEANCPSGWSERATIAVLLHNSSSADRLGADIAGATKISPDYTYDNQKLCWRG